MASRCVEPKDNYPSSLQLPSALQTFLLKAMIHLCSGPLHLSRRCGHRASAAAWTRLKDLLLSSRRHCHGFFLKKIQAQSLFSGSFCCKHSGIVKRPECWLFVFFPVLLDYPELWSEACVTTCHFHHRL